MSKISYKPRVRGLSWRSKRSEEQEHGLTLLYSYCDCVSIQNCDSIKNASNDSLCLCILNRDSGDIWPCYSPETWIEKRSEKREKFKLI